MPSITFDLEDKTLCEGCPFDIKQGSRCQGGFVRQYLKVWETGNKAPCPGHPMLPPGVSCGHDHGTETKSAWVRTHSCIAITDPDANVSGALAKEKIQPITHERKYTGRVPLRIDKPEQEKPKGPDDGQEPEPARV